MTLDLDQFEGHTPGPWRQDAGSVYVEIRSKDGTICDWDCRGRSVAPNLADTVLMSAAPELLARVRELESDVDTLRAALESR
jgi:hypothetical protein